MPNPKKTILYWFIHSTGLRKETAICEENKCWKTEDCRRKPNESRFQLQNLVWKQSDMLIFLFYIVKVFTMGPPKSSSTVSDFLKRFRSLNNCYIENDMKKMICLKVIKNACVKLLWILGLCRIILNGFERWRRTQHYFISCLQIHKSYLVNYTSNWDDCFWATDLVECLNHRRFVIAQ